MSTQYSSSLRFWEGQQNDPAIAGNWGTPLSTNFTLLDSAIAGTASVNIAGLTTYNLTTANGAADQARELVQDYIGALSATCTVTLPNVPKIGWARNDTTGGHNVIESAGAGTKATIAPDGYWYFRATDGASNALLPSVAVGALKVVGALTVQGAATLSGTQTFQAGATITGLDSGGMQLRLVNGSYGVTLLNDGISAFLLQTAAGDPFGTFTAFRPFSWNLSTGAVLIDNSGAGVSFGGVVTISGSSLRTGLTGWDYTPSGGSAIAGASLTIALNVGASGILAGAYAAVSDIRVKSEVLDITPQQGEAFVRTSRPKTYLKHGIKESGFVAQDMIRAGYEHMVNSSPCEGLAELTEDGLTSKQDVMLSLAYDQTIAYLTAALQSALARIDALEQARA